jgi:hypothetical protein
MFIDIVSDYGTNARKPILIWMILVIVIFSFLYFISNGISEYNFLIISILVLLQQQLLVLEMSLQKDLGKL